MEWESDSPCHTYPREGCRSSRGHGGWELEFEDCGAIPAWGLLLTVERWTKRMWGRRLWREMPVEGGRAAREARWYSRITRSGWCHHHSLSLPSSQNWQLNNRKAGPSNPWGTEVQSWLQSGGPFYVPDALNNREGPQAMESSKCLNGRSYGERLAKEAFWSQVTRGLKNRLL